MLLLSNFQKEPDDRERRPLKFVVMVEEHQLHSSFIFVNISSLFISLQGSLLRIGDEQAALSLLSAAVTKGNRNLTVNRDLQ